MISYSYRSFTDEDIKDINIWSSEDLDKFDYIKIPNMSGVRKRSLFSHYHHMSLDVLKETGNSVPTMLKDLAVKDIVEIGKDNLCPITFTYCLSNRNSTKGEDDRVLECGLYSYKNDEQGHFMLTFKIKLEHILIAIDNFKNNIRYIQDHLEDVLDPVLPIEENNKLINTYVIPVYIFTKRHRDSKPKYIRFSNHVKNDNALYVLVLLKFMVYSLERYVFANTFIWYNLNNKKSYKVSTNTEVLFESKRPVNRENLAHIARSNKYLVVCLDSVNNIPLVITTHRKNIYSGTSGKLYSLCAYKFQVIGHYQHYWIGKGRKTRIKKWIDPYYKNDDKQYNVVKEYIKSGEEAPRD